MTQQSQSQQQNEEYLDYLADAFCTEAKKENDKLAILALAAGAGIWGLSGNMIAGLALGGCILLYSDKSVRASNRALMAIEKNQIAAPFLKGDSFNDFRHKFGEDFTLKQLKQAHEYGLPMQPDAEDFLFKQCPELEKKMFDTTPKQLPASTENPKNSAGLLQRLKAECPELLSLIKAPPIRLVGFQRTGKSSFARKLALLRMILLPGHSVLWATPHLEADNRVPTILNPIGYSPDGKKDFASIEAAWSDIQKQIDQGKHPQKTIVWDEFGSYDAFENLELLGASLRSLLRESSKHEYYPILIAHGDQAAFYPGVSGILTTLKQGTVKVETIGTAANDFGEMKPTGEVKIHTLDGKVKQFKVPDWLTEEYLLNLLAVKQEQASPENEPPAVLDSLFQALQPTEPVDQPEVTPDESVQRRQPEQEPDPWQKVDAELTKQLQAIAQKFESGELEPKFKDDLQDSLPVIKQLIGDRREDLLRIILLSMERGYIKARHVQQTNKKCFEGMKPEAIRGLFNELDEMGVGEMIGDDDRAGYRAFKTDEREVP